MKACPSCSKLGMPAIHPGSQCTARMCQLCGHIEELVDPYTEECVKMIQAAAHKIIEMVSLPPANTQATADAVGGPQ